MTNVIREVISVIGFLCVVIGIGILSVPAAIITCGVLTMGVCVTAEIIDRNNNKKADK